MEFKTKLDSEVSEFVFQLSDILSVLISAILGKISKLKK